MSIFECMACYPMLCHCGGTEFRPKGGMCMTCQRSGEDCSGFAFFDMPVISMHRDEERNMTVKTVRCTEHQRKEEGRG